MQLHLIRFAIPVICLAGILALICLLAGIGLRKSELSFVVPFFFGPPIVLALLGYLGTKSRALPVKLLVSATLSTALWIFTTLAMLPFGGNGQAGMGIMLIGIVQWIIVVLATLAFVFLRKR